MFITEEDYRVVIGENALKVVSQASQELCLCLRQMWFFPHRPSDLLLQLSFSWSFFLSVVKMAHSNQLLLQNLQGQYNHRFL